MEWEEQGEWDAEAVQRRPDNISYPLLKCIVPTAAKMHTQVGVRWHIIFSPQFPLPRVPEQLSRGWCMLLQSLPLSYTPVCARVLA